MSTQVSARRYKDVSEVIMAGLRLLKNEESKVMALRNAIQEGLKVQELMTLILMQISRN